MAATRRSLIEELGRSVQRYQRSVQAFDDLVGRRLGLGPADMRCLDWLVGGPCSAGDLARASGLRPSATTVLIDRLSERGLVERVRPEGDRRKVMVQMTAEGEQLMWTYYGPTVAEGTEMLKQFTTDEIRLVQRFLDASREVTDRQRGLLE